MIGGRGPGWGADWGTVDSIPADARSAASDAEAAAVVAEARRAGQPVPPVVLAGGDLARTLGMPAAPPGSAATPATAPETGVRVDVDVGAVLVDGLLHWFVAHLVARRSWWWGRLLVVANASFIGSWNVAPRAHPGDGRLDTLDARPSLAVRLAARRRLPAGTHVPHPDIVQRRSAAVQFALDPALDIRLDGHRIARAAALSVRVEPAALEVWIPR